MRLRSSIILSVVTALAIGAGACANQKGPAQAAIKNAQDAFAPVTAEAQKYVPDQATAIQTSIAVAKDTFDKGDYAGALTKAQGVLPQISALGSAIALKKTQLTSQWATMAEGMPKMLEALKSRLDILSKSKALPAGLTKLTVDNAKSSVDSASRTFEDAKASAASGDVATAVSNVTISRGRLIEVMRSLNMTVPGGGE